MTTEEISPTKVFNAKAFLTVVLTAVYLGGLVWAMYLGHLDVQSFIAGIGPTFGAVFKSWFDDTP